MKTAIKKLFIIMVALVLTLSLFACSNSDKEKEMSSYNIKATLDDSSKILDCYMTVDYINLFDIELNKVNFNLYPNAYKENAQVSPIDSLDLARAYPNGKSYGGIEIKSVSIGGKPVTFSICGKAKDNILSVPLFETIMPGDRVCMDMTFSVRLPNMRHRFGYLNKTINLGNWYPIACMYSGGDFLDEPYYSIGDPFYSQVSNYKCEITAPSKYNIATTGTQKIVDNGATKTFVASENKVRDFAAVIGEFNVISSKVKNTTVSYYFVEDAASELHLKTALEAVEFFSNTFGDYPFSSFSVVKTDFLMGGMEYPNLVYIASDLTGALIDEVIIHETAHQWWYSSVGNDQINAAWLDEGLAEFSTSYFYDKNPGYNVGYNDRISDSMTKFIIYADMMEDKLNTKMERNATEFSSSTEYVFMTYQKGQLLFDCLKSLVGEKNLIASLKNYAVDNAFDFGTKDKLIAAIEKTANTSVQKVVNSWVDGTVKLFGGR